MIGWYEDYHTLDPRKIEPEDDDSNEVVVAKAFIRLYRDLDGVSDGMTFAEIERLNGLVPALKSAIEVLKAGHGLSITEHVPESRDRRSNP